MSYVCAGCGTVTEKVVLTCYNCQQWMRHVQQLTRERDEALRVGEHLMESTLRLEAIVVQRARERDEAEEVAARLDRKYARTLLDNMTLRTLLSEAHQTILRLVDQQAMPDDWWKDCADRLKAALENLR